jgi:Rod binding domain-containing protein
MPISIKGNPAVKTPQNIPKVYKNIAEGMERQFLQYMLEKMKDTAKTENQDSATKYYNSLMNNEHAKAMAKKDGGLGLQKMILQQIYPGFQKAAKAPTPGPKTIPKAYIEGNKL